MSWTKSLAERKLPFEYPLRVALQLYGRTLLQSLIGAGISCLLFGIALLIVHSSKPFALIVLIVTVGTLANAIYNLRTWYVERSSPWARIRNSEAVEDLSLRQPGSGGLFVATSGEERREEEGADPAPAADEERIERQLEAFVEPLHQLLLLRAVMAAHQETGKEIVRPIPLSGPAEGATEGQAYLLQLRTRTRPVTLELSPEQIAAIRFELRAEGDKLNVYADFGSGEFREVHLSLGGSENLQSQTAQPGPIRTAEQYEQPGTEGSAVVRWEELTARGLAVVRLMVKGYSSARIALELGISERAAAASIADIKSVLGVTSREEAVAQAIRLGLHEPREGPDALVRHVLGLKPLGQSGAEDTPGDPAADQERGAEQA